MTLVLWTASTLRLLWQGSVMVLSSHLHRQRGYKYHLSYLYLQTCVLTNGVLGCRRTDGHNNICSAAPPPDLWQACIQRLQVDCAHFWLLLVPSFTGWTDAIFSLTPGWAS